MKTFRCRTILIAFLLALLLPGCGSFGGGNSGGEAVPSFCPSETEFQSTASDSGIPKAYYVDYMTDLVTPLEITLLACDPDDPSTAAGLTWSIVTPPFLGSVSALAGTYSSSPYQLTYTPSVIGTDNFWYQVDDGTYPSNQAEVRIRVVELPTWARTYGDSRVDYTNSAVSTSDGGYILSGGTSDTTDFGDPTRDILVIKVDGRGAIQWQRTYGGSNDDDLQQIQQTADGGYLVLGYTKYPPFGTPSWYDAWVLKLDSAGDIIWQRTYGLERWDAPQSFQITSDGGYIITGDTDSYDFVNSNNAFYLLKLNQDGTVAWTNYYLDGNTGAARPRRIINTSDGGYAVVGRTTASGAGDEDGWVVKYTAGGAISWQKTYGSPRVDEFRDIQQTIDGGYIVAGNSQAFTSSIMQAWIVKLSSSGDIQWQKAYGGIEGEEAKTVFQTQDGGYMVAGETASFGNGNFDLFLMKLDPGGSIIWQKTFGGADGDRNGRVLEAQNGGYLLYGETQSFGAGGWDMWVLKLDDSGNLGGSCGLDNTPAMAASDTTAVAATSNAVGSSLTFYTSSTSAAVQTTLKVSGNQCTGL